MQCGTNIFQARKAMGYSQETLAEQCGVSRQAVSRWERDEICPEADKLVLLSRLLELPLDALLPGGWSGRTKPSSCGNAQIPKEDGAGFQGILIKESLQNDAVLDLVEIRRVELWQTLGSPRYWTAITFSSAYGDFPARVQACLNEGWFADMERNHIKFIVFSDQILHYEIGNAAQKRAVWDICRQKGFPEEQMNWPE